MTTQIKKIPEFKPVKKLSPFVADPHNTRGGAKGKKGSMVIAGAAGVKKSSAQSSIKKGGSGDR